MRVSLRGKMPLTAEPERRNRRQIQACELDQNAGQNWAFEHG
jgi:hypothetical protein